MGKLKAQLHVSDQYTTAAAFIRTRVMINATLDNDRCFQKYDASKKVMRTGLQYAYIRM